MISDFKVMTHLIYEYKKGLRNLALITLPAINRQNAENMLTLKGIDYIVQEVSSEKINIFFGDIRCLNIVRSFNQPSLSKLSNEQDFILGIMLGYDRTKQCERYLSRFSKQNQQKTSTLAQAV
ncbi:hypothetical protein HW49_05690 [Porphyromonadaceae bacterium COT-184 OH4590]|nr:hypothetical protein HW49_05690 [Porphyromonadaceae bacterium COT-184 OH4590]